MKRLLTFLYTYAFMLMVGSSASAEVPFKQNVPTKSFGPGEELQYVLQYGFITGGRASLTVKDTLLNNKRVYHMVGSGYTSGLTDKIFRVRDVYESFFDPKTMYPVKSIRNISEGRYKWYNEAVFKHGRDSTHVSSQRSGEKYVTADIYDIISAFYVGREKHFNDNMVKGQIIVLNTYFADEVFPLRIRYMGLETIKTRFGMMECYKFSPVTEVGRAFKNDDDMQVWITRDANKLPVRVRFNLVVGAFVCDLEQFRGLQNPFSSFVPQ
jgi:hypothetical protein